MNPPTTTVRPAGTGFSRRTIIVLRITLGVMIGGTCLLLALNSADSTLFKPPFMIVCSAVVLAILAFASLERGIDLDLHAVHGIFAVWLVAAALSLLRASNFDLGLEGLSFLFCYALIFFTAALLASKEFNAQINLLFVILAAVSCAVALIQDNVTLPWLRFLTGAGQRAISTFGNEDYFAGFLVLMLPIAVGQALLRRKSSPARIAYIIVVAGILASLVRSGSRSAWIAALGAMILFGFMLAKSSRQRWLVLGAAIGCAALALLLFPGIVEHRLGQILQSGGGSSFLRRLYFYQGAWNSFHASPLIGNGVGNFIVFLPKFRSPHYWMNRSEDIVPHAHNEFLEILAETGLLGLLCFLAILFLYARSAIRALKTLQGRDRIIRAGFYAAAAACLIDNLGSMDLRTTPVAVCFWTILGLSSSPVAGRTIHVGMQTSQAMRRLRFVVPLAAAAFLWWYVPFVADRYSADKEYLSGILLRAQNDLEGSTLQFLAAVQDYPGIADARFYLSANEIQARRFEDARRELHGLLDRYPYYPKARLLLALSFFQGGDTSAAREEIAGELKIEDSPQTLYYAALIEDRPGREASTFGFAARLVDGAVESGLTDYLPETLELLRRISGDIRRRAEILDLVAKIKERFPENGQLLGESAFTYFSLGELQRAHATVGAALSIKGIDGRLAQGLRELSEKIDARIAADTLRPR